MAVSEPIPDVVTGSSPVLTTVPDATIRMTDVLHIMVVRTYTLRVEKGKTITLASVTNRDSSERRANSQVGVMREGFRVPKIGGYRY